MAELRRARRHSCQHRFMAACSTRSDPLHLRDGTGVRGTGSHLAGGPENAARRRALHGRSGGQLRRLWTGNARARLRRGSKRRPRLSLCRRAPRAARDARRAAGRRPTSTSSLPPAPGRLAAARQATTTIPIVTVSGSDPVRRRLGKDAGAARRHGDRAFGHLPRARAEAPRDHEGAAARVFSDRNDLRAARTARRRQRLSRDTVPQPSAWACSRSASLAQRRRP